MDGVVGSVLQGISERARKSKAVFLRGLASVGQCNVAKAVRKSESTISRLKSDPDFDDFFEVLAAAGIKCVPEEMRCFNPKDVEVLLHGHRRWTEHLQSVEQLWDDE